MLLSVKNLQSFYGDIQALHDVSMQVNVGQIVTLVGSNAAGKSTLINCISGIIHQKTGKIEFSGQQTEKLPAYKMVNLGVVQIPEGRRVFPFMSVMENLELGCYPRSRERKRRRTSPEFLDLLPI